MDISFQILIALAALSLLINIYRLYRAFLQKSKDVNEDQKLAKLSIIFGLSGILLAFLGSLIGLILGIISLKGKKLKQLSYIGISISILSLIPWLLVVILGE